MRFLFAAACFSGFLFVLIAEHSAESCSCEEADVCSAIKALETKLEAKFEKLLALVTPLGDFEVTYLQRFVLISFFFFIPNT